jgi:hypothetical protein
MTTVASGRRPARGAPARRHDRLACPKASGGATPLWGVAFSRRRLLPPVGVPALASGNAATKTGGQRGGGR